MIFENLISIFLNIYINVYVCYEICQQIQLLSYYTHMMSTVHISFIIYNLYITKYLYNTYF